MKEKIIGFDIDGVLANFEEKLRACAARLFPELVLTQTWNLGMNDNQAHLALATLFENDHKFWTSLSPMAKPHEFSMINLLSQEYTTYFITHRHTPKGWWTAQNQSVEWLRMMGIDFPNVVITGEKGDACNMLGLTHYIDDRPSFIEDCLMKAWTRTNIYGMRRPWNQKEEARLVIFPKGFFVPTIGKGAIFVDTIEEYIQAIRRD